MKRKNLPACSPEQLEAEAWVNRTFECCVVERVVDELIPTRYSVTARRAHEEYGAVWVHYERAEPGKPTRECATLWPVFRDRYVANRNR